MAKSRVVGIPKLRRLLRRLPDTTTEEVRKEIAASALRLLNEMKSGAPNARTADAMRVVVARDGLTARIGLIGKRANRKGFLARIFEFGAKPHLMPTRNGVTLRKAVAHPGMSARPFFFAPAQQQRPAIIARIRKSVNEALAKASQGS